MFSMMQFYHCLITSAKKLKKLLASYTVKVRRNASEEFDALRSLRSRQRGVSVLVGVGDSTHRMLNVNDAMGFPRNE